MKLESFPVTPALKASLHARFRELPETVALREDPEFFSLVVSLGIQQEIGTIHDELSVFLFDADTGTRIPREHLRAEIVRARDARGRPSYGVRIWAAPTAGQSVRRLDPRVRGLRTLTHPEASFDADGNLHQLVFFPAVITEIAARAGAELVSVRPWGINTIFDGFDPTRSYYEGNMWEFINADAIRYARLLERRQIVFFGTHDLVSHVAGVRAEEWPGLEARGRAARERFEAYFAGVARPAPFALVLPYALGMLLDDLAQPMNYGSVSRKHVVSLLMDALDRRVIDPRASPYLLKYPPSIERLIAVARSDDPERARREGAAVLAGVVEELRRYSWSTVPALSAGSAISEPTSSGYSSIRC
jgi:hypothetical protein